MTFFSDLITDPVFFIFCLLPPLPFFEGEGGTDRVLWGRSRKVVGYPHNLSRSTPKDPVAREAFMEVLGFAKVTKLKLVVDSGTESLP